MEVEPIGCPQWIGLRGSGGKGKIKDVSKPWVLNNGWDGGIFSKVKKSGGGKFSLESPESILNSLILNVL